MDKRYLFSLVLVITLLLSSCGVVDDEDNIPMIMPDNAPVIIQESQEAGTVIEKEIDYDLINEAYSLLV